MKKKTIYIWEAPRNPKMTDEQIRELAKRLWTKNTKDKKKKH